MPQCFYCLEHYDYLTFIAAINSHACFRCIDRCIALTQKIRANPKISHAEREEAMRMEEMLLRYWYELRRK
jgi:hypothetical protein